MDVEFGDDDLDRLEVELGADRGYPSSVAKAFRKRMQQIRSAQDERDFYTLKSLRFEKLKGKRSHQYSMRLNDQWRLILELREGSPKKVIILSIEDYH